MKKLGSPGVVGESGKEGSRLKEALQRGLGREETVGKRQRDTRQAPQRAGGLCGLGGWRRCAQSATQLYWLWGSQGTRRRIGSLRSGRSQGYGAQIWLQAIGEVGDVGDVRHARGALP